MAMTKKNQRYTAELERAHTLQTLAPTLMDRYYWKGYIAGLNRGFDKHQTPETDDKHALYWNYGNMPNNKHLPTEETLCLRKLGKGYRSGLFFALGNKAGRPTIADKYLNRIGVSKILHTRIKDLSKALGISPAEFRRRAYRVYCTTIEKRLKKGKQTDI